MVEIDLVVFGALPEMPAPNLMIEPLIPAGKVIRLAIVIGDMLLQCQTISVGPATDHRSCARKMFV